MTQWQYIKKFLSFVQEKVPSISHVKYFSDGCAGQYKNCNYFFNLCFGLSAEWNFFATSHGKGPCDGLDSTVKRLATKASLQRYSEGRVSDQYSLQYLFFDFCSANIKNINFVYICKI